MWNDGLRFVLDLAATEHFFWLAVTCLVFVGCEYLVQKLRCKQYIPAAALAMAIMVVLLVALEVPYEEYAAHTLMITFLLAPATVALAFPIYKQWRRLRLLWLPIMCSVFFGAVVASVSAFLMAKIFTSEKEILLTVLSKSITTPIAMAVTEKIGGDVALVAVIVILVGVVGSVTAPIVFRIVGVDSHLARGIVYGVTAHGLGTAAALEESEETGAFSGLAMGLTGIVTAVMMPFIVFLLL